MHACHFMAEQRGAHHAPGNRFAVLKAAVTSDGFERVAKGVTEVEDLAEAGFPFVFADDAGLDDDGAANDVVERGGVTTQDRIDAFFEEGEKFGVGDYAVLDDFGQAATEFALRESGESFGIDEDQLRGIERADEVFAFGQIDAGFAADGAVHLSDQGGGYLDERDAAQIRGGDKAGDVADDTTADGDQQGMAVSACSNEHLRRFFDGG